MQMRLVDQKKKAAIVLLVIGIVEAGFWSFTYLQKHKSTNAGLADAAAASPGTTGEMPASLHLVDASVVEGGSRRRPPLDPPHAREERNAMRDRIYRAFGQPEPAAQAPGKPAKFMPLTDEGVIDATYILDHVSNDLTPLLEQCRSEMLTRIPDAGTHLMFEFTVVGDPSVGGVVESAELSPESTITDPAMVECVRQSTLSMTFDPPPNGGAVTVEVMTDFDAGTPPTK